MDKTYILVDKVYLEELNSFKLYLYDNTNGIIIKVIAPITKSINLTQLEDVENAIQNIE
jgi:transcriptional regulator of NAD metabolism